MYIVFAIDYLRNLILTTVKLS